MAASDSDGEEDEQQSSSGDEDDSSSSDGSSSSGEEDSDSEDTGDDGGDGDEAENRELKQARVRSDIQEMRNMVGEMEKLKQRLLFRLEREKQAKLEEANWQQQQAADKELRQQQLQREEEEAERKMREESKTAQEVAIQEQEQQRVSPERKVVEIGVQTEVSAAPVEQMMSHGVAQQVPKSPLASPHRRTGSVSKQTSVLAEGQSARLSLYDLGKNYDMQEANASLATKRESQQQKQTYGSAPAPAVSDARDAPAPPSEVSDSDTFFIRRDSNRTNWLPDLPGHNDRFRRSQDSVLDSEYGSEDEHIGSPTSQEGSRASKSAFQTLRNSILSSIHEGNSENAVPSTPAASSKLFESRRSRFGQSNLSNHGGDDAAKTDEQREQEAVQSLLFE